jgi:NAD(P)-dependent dehydrogenase (short-subunit alcohol dehydrogenase family)
MRLKRREPRRELEDHLGSPYIYFHLVHLPISEKLQFIGLFSRIILSNHGRCAIDERTTVPLVLIFHHAASLTNAWNESRERHQPRRNTYSQKYRPRFLKPQYLSLTQSLDMPTAVVTGANSGIGHAFAQLLIKEGYRVIAGDVTLGEPIKGLGCDVAPLDVTSSTSIEEFKKHVGDQPIDLLLNIAGIMAPHDKDSLEGIDHDVLHRTFAVNTYGPLLLTQALLPNLFRSPHPRVAVMSSRMGSISDNSSGGSYAYRASKAAVNALFKSLAVDLKPKNVIVLILHPGIVQTNIFGDVAEIKGSVSPAEAVSELWRVLMSKGMESTGTWWHRNGQELPW